MDHDRTEGRQASHHKHCKNYRDRTREGPMLDKMGLLRAVALLMAAQQGVIDLTDDDKALICKALGNHAPKSGA